MIDPNHISYVPFPVGKRFRIVPPNDTSDGGGRIDLILIRGAFGSGEHETTSSCIEVLERLEGLEDVEVLDLGSGTGVLAIAALKLGASSAVCVDIAPGAVEVCRRNCEENGVGARVEHVCGTLVGAPETRFDLVLANVYTDVLLEVAPELTRRANSMARMVLSGVATEFVYDVKLRYERLGWRADESWGGEISALCS